MGDEGVLEARLLVEIRRFSPIWSAKIREVWGRQPSSCVQWRRMATVSAHARCKLLKRFVPVSDYNWFILLQDFISSKTLNSVSSDGVDECSYHPGSLVIAPGSGARWLGRAVARLLGKLGLSLRFNLRGCRCHGHILAGRLRGRKRRCSYGHHLGDGRTRVARNGRHIDGDFATDCVRFPIWADLISVTWRAFDIATGRSHVRRFMRDHLAIAGFEFADHLVRTIGRRCIFGQINFI